MSALRTGDAGALEQVQAPAALALADPLDTVGALGAERAKYDAVILSLRACALIRAGLLARALVLGALMNVSRRLAFGGRAIVLEAGVYRMTM